MKCRLCAIMGTGISKIMFRNEEWHGKREDKVLSVV